MSALRICAVVVALLVASPLPAAAPPPALPLARWLKDLGSDDEATWRAAFRRLWKAGKAAEPALRAALKHSDPDVMLRARVILDRLKWNIQPDTPAAVVRLIERYRDGDAAQRRGTVRQLLAQGPAGHIALRRLLAGETDIPLRQYATDSLERAGRLLLRDLLARGRRATAQEVLQAAVEEGSAQAMRDLAALWVLTGETAARARELQRRAASGDRKAAAQAAYLHRASGDRAAARRLAEKAGDVALLGGILDEMEDFKALARLRPPDIAASPGRLAVVLYHAGDRKGAEEAFRRIPATEHWMRTQVLYFTGRPRQGIEEEKRFNLFGACQLLALQGRRREALALSAEKVKSPTDPYQHGLLLVEQAVVAQHAGQKDRAGKLLSQAIRVAGIIVDAGNRDGVLAAAGRAGARMKRRREVLDEVGRALDRIKPASAPFFLLLDLSPADYDLVPEWWDYLRYRSPGVLPSVTLARLRGWFVEGKADKEFDALLDEVERSPAIVGDDKDRWRLRMARTCVVVGKPKKAEAILRAVAPALDTAEAYVRLGDFYVEGKQWREAAAEYARALSRERGNHLALAGRGVALTRLGRAKEGRALLRQARLLPLADEAARSELAQALARSGLQEEADAEEVLLTRTAAFRSVALTTVASGLADRAARQDRPLEAARYYRRVYLNLALGSGMLLERTDYLLMPARAHLNQARGLLAQGKLDDALRESKKALEYLPEKISEVIEVVRALDRAKRKGDADKLFAEAFAHQQKACAFASKAADFHNRLAWLAARCGRQLDRALRHAQAAATLRPESASFGDTLAEVQFQRGDQVVAVTAMKRVLKLAPGDDYFKAQLKRIESGDPGTDLPRR